MANAQRERADEILHQALNAPSEERTTLVERACGGDESLRREVHSLLVAADVMEQEFLETPVLPVHGVAPKSGVDAGDRVGPYRLVREVGRGGMGRVFEALRDDEEFEQEVALKVLKRGLDTDEIVRRFLHERQILARLHHPNIAALLDGGTTAEGLPYFVMEHVHGVPIHRYCDEHRLTVRQRLGLVLKVCDAVQFAHQNLVVHRDLKPGNILVSEEGEPKLLDFGIAKLLESDQSPLTSAGMHPMTPEYASPEQVLGRPVTTASDVYSLGGLLYQLLSGRHPFPPGERHGTDLLQWVCHGEPEAPSRVLDRPGETVTAATVSAARAVEPRALRRRLAGDLDAVVLKALAKDPQRRYGSVQGLAGDIRRHLEGRPVEARHWTLGYQVGKFLRLHWVAVSATVLILGIVVALGVSWDLARTTQAEQRKSRALETFLTDLFQQPARRPQGEELTVRAMLDRAEINLSETLAGQPQVRAMFLNTLGYGRLELREYEGAEKLLKESVRLRRVTPGVRSNDLARSLVNLAALREALGDLSAAERLLEEANRLVSRDDPVLRAVIHHNRASVFDSEGRLELAEEEYREALRLRRELHGDEHPEVAWILNNLGYNLRQQGERNEEAKSYYQRNLLPHRRANPALEAPVAASLLNLGVLLWDEGETGPAQVLFRESLQRHEHLFGPRDPQTANVQHNLAVLLHREGALDEAEGLYRDALSAMERNYGQDHRYVAGVLRNLAALELEIGNLDAAEADIRQALRIYRGILDGDPWRFAASESVLGGCLLARGEIDLAEPLIRGAYAVLFEQKGEGSAYTQEAQARVEALDRERGAP